MASLFRAAAKQGIARDYVRRLLAAGTATEDTSPIEQALIDPLSERELDVLRLRRLAGRQGLQALSHHC